MGPNPPWNPLYIFDYSGGTYDSTRDELLVWGGGHGDYPGNEVYAFSRATGKWARLTERSPYSATQTVDALADGNPAARHTAASLAYLKLGGLDGFFVHGGSLWPGGHPTAGSWFFHRDALKWEQLPATGADYGSTSLFDVAVWDPVRKVVHVRVRNGLRDYDPLGKKWIWKGNAEWNEREVTGAFDPERQLFIIIGKGWTEAWDTSANPWKAKSVAFTGDLAAVTVRAPGFVFDPVGKRYIAWAGGRTLYELNRDTWAWTQLPASGADPGAAYNVGTFGRFAFVPSTYGLLVVNSVDGNVFYFQLPASAAR
jgi:hypothetical protein